MGRKSRLKRERRENAANGTEILPGVWAKQEGRRIKIESKRTTEEWIDQVSRLRNMTKQIEVEISQLVKELRERLRSLPTLQLLTQLAGAIVMHDPEKSGDPTSEYPLITLEYPTWLALLESAPTSPGPAELIDGPKFEEVLSRIQNLLAKVVWYYISRGAPVPGQRPSASQEIQFATRVYELNVRNPGYYHHNSEVLHELFRPFQEEIQEFLGFGIDDAINLGDSLGEIVAVALDEYRDRVKDAESDLLGRVEAYVSTGALPEGANQAMMEKLRILEPSERSKAVQNLVIGWGLYIMEDVFTVSDEEVAVGTGLSTDTARALLENFSLSFGQEPIANSWPSRYQPLEHAPLLRLPDGSYYVHLVTKLLWAIRPNLEHVLLSQLNTKEKYSRHRSIFLETKTLELIARCLPGATSHHDLIYRAADKEGKDTNYQLDGLLTYDSILFLVESKSGSISPQARRGAPSLEEDLEKVIGEAHDQALRALDYIQSASQVTFDVRQEGQISIRREDFSRIILVTSSLDTLSAFTPDISELSNLGVVRDRDFPWAIDLLDLYVIAELIEFGPQLIHYIQCRVGLISQPVRSFDELDYLGHYFKFGLNLDYEMSSNPTNVAITSHTADFDDFFRFQMGQRKTPATKPAQELPADLREQVLSICRAQDPGYVELVCAMLDDWRSSLPES